MTNSAPTRSGVRPRSREHSSARPLPLVARIENDELPPRLQNLTVIKPSSLSKSQRAGLKYEAQVLERLQREASDFGGEVLAKPWYRKRLSAARYSYHQPDFELILPNNNIVVGEVKLRAVREGFVKLVSNYMPLVSAFYGPGFHIHGLLICHWFDPDLRRQPIVRTFCPSENFYALPSKLQYHIWKPRYD